MGAGSLSEEGGMKEEGGREEARSLGEEGICSEGRDMKIWKWYLGERKVEGIQRNRETSNNNRPDGSCGAVSLFCGFLNCGENRIWSVRVRERKDWRRDRRREMRRGSKKVGGTRRKGVKIEGGGANEQERVG